MKVLVTGANGFVGPHVLNALHQAGHEPIALSHGEPNTDEKILSTTYLPSVDLLDRPAVDRLKLGDIQGIIHLAGLAAVGPSFEQPRRYLDANGGMQINLLEAVVRQGGSPRVVVVSSGSLYDPASSLPLTESSAVRCSSPYAVSKLSQEQLAWYYSIRGLECLVARPFNHIGPGQRPGFLVPDLCRQLAAIKASHQQSVQVGNLSALRDYTDVRDIARAYVLMLESGQTGETYNVCRGTAYSGDDILSRLIELAGLAGIKVETNPAKLRPVDAPEIYGDSTKLQDDTGWKPREPLESSLKAALVDVGLGA